MTDTTCESCGAIIEDGESMCESCVDEMRLREIARLRVRVEELERERDAWKLASGLECGGDPDGVTPDNTQRYWEWVERERDEARAEVVELRVENERLRDESSACPDIRSGRHLAIVRNWIKWHASNGSQVIWGSDNTLRFLNVTVSDMEFLAQRIANAADPEREP